MVWKEWPLLEDALFSPELDCTGVQRGNGGVHTLEAVLDAHGLEGLLLTDHVLEACIRPDGSQQLVHVFRSNLGVGNQQGRVKEGRSVGVNTFVGIGGDGQLDRKSVV